MKTKIISSILIYCMMIQISLNHIGCTSFYPVKGGIDLSEYNKHDGRIAVKMKDQTVLNVTTKNIFFIDKPSDVIYGIGKERYFNLASHRANDFAGTIEKNIIDSTRVLESKPVIYKLFANKGNRMLTFEKGKMFSISPDSGSGFYLVLDNNKKEIRKIYNYDIEEIKVQKTDWVGTVLFVSVIIGVTAALLVATSDNFFSWETGSGW